MRKVALYGLAVVCLIALFALSGPDAQKLLVGDGSSTSSTVPVSVANFPAVQTVQVQKTVNVTGSVAVTNFPAVQEVAGTVSVGNLPATQTVTGTVQVANLPLDAEGNVKVSTPPSTAQAPIRFVGYSQAHFVVASMYQGSLPLGRACGAEFPGTRICDVNEVLRSAPIAHDFNETAWAFVPGDAAEIHPRIFCLNADGQVGGCAGLSLPVACCGY